MGVDSLYGDVAVSNEPGAPLGSEEPVYLLRAIDPSAPAVIDAHADQAQQAGAPDDHVRGIRHAAKQMRSWQAAHPDQTSDTPTR